VRAGSPTDAAIYADIVLGLPEFFTPDAAIPHRRSTICMAAHPS
jgi:hypothetical protein